MRSSVLVPINPLTQLEIESTTLRFCISFSTSSNAWDKLALKLLSAVPFAANAFGVKDSNTGNLFKRPIVAVTLSIVPAKVSIEAFAFSASLAFLPKVLDINCRAPASTPITIPTVPKEPATANILEPTAANPPCARVLNFAKPLVPLSETSLFNKVQAPVIPTIRAFSAAFDMALALSTFARKSWYLCSAIVSGSNLPNGLSATPCRPPCPCSKASFF